MLKYTILLLMLLIASQRSFAQYFGGNEDGAGYVVLSQSSCPPLVSDFVFYGGIADGHSDAGIIQSSCPPLVSDFVFYGGNADGSGDAGIIQSSCPPLVSDFVFYGGNADGHGDAGIIQSNCPPLVSDFVFYGGNADGSGDAGIIQSICPPLVSDFVFYGGNADGYSDAGIIQSNCPPLVSDFVFYGGNADGYSDAGITQSICPPLLSDFIFHGGSMSGFSFSVREQTICPNITPLPVELIDFEIDCLNDQLKINWTTASETNNKEFVVEHSFDGINFKSLLVKNGAGNSQTKINYQGALLNSDSIGMYFRLKQIDYNGKYKYSKIIYQICDSNIPNIKIFPNPTNESVTIVTNNKLLGIQVTNDLGENLMDVSNIAVNNTTTLNLSKLLPGHYLLTINTNAGLFFRSIIKVQ